MSDSRTRISVVIITYNKAFELDLVLTALSRQNYDMKKVEVVVVNDGSTDETSRVVRDHQKDLPVREVALPHLGKRGELRNIGAKSAVGQRLIFLDGDMVVARDFIRVHDLATRSSRWTVSLGTRKCLIEYDKKFLDKKVVEDHFDIIEQFPAINDERTLAFDFQSRVKAELKNTWTLMYSHNFCVWKTAFDRVGGFDPDFSKWWGAEDIELGYRLQGSGCRLRVEKKAVCYHLYHPVDTSRNINDLKKNLRLFFDKHPCFEVELFTQEYKIWPKEYNLLRDKLRGGKGQIKTVTEVGLRKRIMERLVENTLLVGITDPRITRSNLVRNVLSPRPGKRPEKYIDLLGIMTPFADRQYDLVLLSGKYKDVDEGLFELLVEEAGRVAKKVMVVTGQEVLELEPGKDRIKPVKRLMFTLGNISGHFLTHYNKYYYHKLAIAAMKAGIQTSVKLVYDPFHDIPHNQGFLWTEDKANQRSLAGLYGKDQNILDQQIPCVMDPMATGASQGSVGQRILWQEIQFPNHETFIQKEVFPAYNKLFLRREKDRARIGVESAGYLPVGIDTPKIKALGQDHRGKPSGFQFLWVNPFVHEISMLHVLLEAFSLVFSQKDKASLLILHSGNKFPRYPHPYLNRTLQEYSDRHLDLSVSSFENYIENKCAPLLRKNKNIRMEQGYLSEERIREAIARADCLVDTHASNALSPMVLESVGMGKKPIIPRGNTYEGYFTEDAYLGVDTEPVSGALFEPKGEIVFPSRRWNYRYMLLNKVKKESLGRRLKEAFTHRDQLRLSPHFVKRFQKEYDWNTVVERLAALI
jgi:glycosyltransferase involved in cell wall biosynthesis